MIKAIRDLIRQIGPNVLSNRHITDNIFMYIENHSGLLAHYRALCHAHGSQSVNMGIGKQIKRMYNLQNTGRSRANSQLIKTYTCH